MLLVVESLGRCAKPAVAKRARKSMGIGGRLLPGQTLDAPARGNSSEMSHAAAVAALCVFGFVDGEMPDLPGIGPLVEKGEIFGVAEANLAADSTADRHHDQPVPFAVSGKIQGSSRDIVKDVYHAAGALGEFC